MRSDNNFDLIRLLAALEVAIVHGIVTLKLGDDPAWLHVIPGVPVFFLISGYLIFPSFRASRNLAHYAKKRVLRIYPALYVCFALCLVLLLVAGQLADVGIGQLVTWGVAQLTIGQFYNPAFLRDFGSGVLNGSLWTISVELQFYLLTPVLAWLTSRFTWLWLPLIGLFAAANVAFSVLGDDSLPGKLLMVSFVPWLFMFLVGAWLSTRDDVVDRIKRTPASGLIVAFCAVAGVTAFAGLPLGTNAINPVMFVVMTPLILRAAYTTPNLSRRLLRGSDISYGIYIYHMPTINTLLAIGGGAFLSCRYIAGFCLCFFLPRRRGSWWSAPLSGVLGAREGGDRDHARVDISSRTN